MLDDSVVFTFQAGPIAAALEDAHRRLIEARFAEALWARRLDVWPGGPTVQKAIGNRLGWLDALLTVTPQVDRLRACAQSIRDEGLTDIVLLGMGGSSLAPEVLRWIIGTAPGFPRFRVLDSVDPDAVRAALEPAATSLFVLASKSGGTIEPNVMAAEAERRLRAAGVANVGSRFIAITDEGTALHTRAVENRFRDVFVNPADIGGRYSVLSFFGMVPAALMGLDIGKLLASAHAMADLCRAADPQVNPGLALGAMMAAGARSGRDKLTLLMADRLVPFGLWVEQLVAESTGKHGRGVVPIAGEDPHVPFGDDRIAVAISLGDEQPPGLERGAGAPRVAITLRDVTDLGAEFLRWEVATAAAGFLLDINPFDEPNVQQAKDATGALLDTFRTQHRLPAPEPHAATEGIRFTLSSAAQEQLGGETAFRFLHLLSPGDYFALLAYLPSEHEEYAPVLRGFCTAVGAGRSCAAMLGYGPRYLHSTGQLHKGGANNGVFLILTAEPGEDLPIPGEPYSFGVLELAQAIGDFQSLERTGRRALLVHLPRRDPALLQRLADKLTSG
jgi:glucose-6-phosphate isomerase